MKEKNTNTKRHTFLDGFKENFETLLRAAENDDLALLECRDKETGKFVPCIVAVHVEDGEFVMTPLARMLEGDPYDQFEAPGDQLEAPGDGGEGELS